ncbi:DUF6090 family protein [Robertkochia flava]|uniref:DUF6090 family protein n=1 Tax=Robertkochia flava TaxID=3447986 RepID=UPI001CCCE087|nr:DUF6090 family protein [Robertkochia marina]
MKFFGKMRLRLFQTKKPAQYLKYASGEIFLVVLGILIALAINNHNENLKEKHRAHKLLNNLLEELHQDSLYLNNVFQVEKDLFLPSAQLLFEVHSGAPAVNNKKLQRAFRFACFTPVIRYTENAYTELISSDLFSKIRSETLKGYIHKYYSQINFLNRYSEQNYQITNNLIEELAFYYEVIPAEDSEDRTISDFLGAAEEHFTANYDLKAFRENRSLNPKLFDVIDIHKDRLGGLEIVRTLRKEIIREINNELSE